MCSISGCFDLLERRAREASLSAPSQHEEHVVHMMQICQKWEGSWRGEEWGGVYIVYIVTCFNLHTKSGQAAVGLAMVHVRASVCVEARNKAIIPKLTRGSRGYMCLMVKGRCMYTQWMVNY